MAYVVQQLLSRIETSLPVRVVSVTTDGAVGLSGFVDAVPVVQMLDGDNNTVDHATIFRLPYCRVQGGENAIIIDPEVGDLGVAVFASRDIANVKVARGDAPPGSYRQFDMADGMYLCGLLNKAPTQYVRFHSGGIEIHSPTEVKVTAPSIKAEADALTATVTGAATLTAATATITASGAASVVGTTVAVTGGAVTIGAAGGESKPLVNGDLIAWINSHVHTSASAGNPTSAPTTTPGAGVQTTATKAN